jgi:flagellar biosynthesis protein FlhF
VEVLALEANSFESFQRQLTGNVAGGLAAARRARNRRFIGPYVIGLVGPAGAGKTTSSVKLALNPDCLGTRRVGLITLDTYRVGGVEELETYAEVADLPLEVVYNVREVPAAMARLRDAEAVIVDTPGRLEDKSWIAALHACNPDEIHLVLPAGLRADVMVESKERFDACCPTHVLLSKLDDVPREAGLAEVAEVLGLPTRWVADGTDVPGGIAPAVPRIVRSLGRLGVPAESLRIAV